MAAQLLSASYKGEVVTLKDLAERNGIKVSTLHSRWKAAGEPECITDAMLVERIPRAPYSRRVPKYSVGGVPMLLHEIATLAGSSVTMVKMRIKKYGPDLSKEHLERRYRPVVTSPEFKRKATIVPFEAGSWERANLPFAGLGGFGKVDRGNFNGYVNKGGQHFPIYTP